MWSTPIRVGKREAHAWKVWERKVNYNDIIIMIILYGANDRRRDTLWLSGRGVGSGCRGLQFESRLRKIWSNDLLLIALQGERGSPILKRDKVTANVINKQCDQMFE